MCAWVLFISVSSPPLVCNSARTGCINGPNPFWKQAVSLPFHAPRDDFTPANLSQIRADITFTLFDEIHIDDANSGGGFGEGDATVRVEKHFLGSFTIPFSTLYREGRIEGLFRMDTPIVNVGYNYSNPLIGYVKRKYQGR